VFLPIIVFYSQQYCKACLKMCKEFAQYMLNLSLSNYLFRMGSEIIIIKIIIIIIIIIMIIGEHDEKLRSLTCLLWLVRFALSKKGKWIDRLEIKVK